MCISSRCLSWLLLSVVQLRLSSQGWRGASKTQARLKQEKQEPRRKTPASHTSGPFATRLTNTSTTRHSHDIPISCNQIEAHPWFPNSELIDFMQAHDILATCYSPFGGQSDQGAVMREDPRVKALAQETGMGVGGLLQSWAVQRGTVPLGKSQSEGEWGLAGFTVYELHRLTGVQIERIRANFDVKRLSPEVMRALDDLDMGGDEGRTCGSSKDTMWGVRLYQN